MIHAIVRLHWWKNLPTLCIYLPTFSLHLRLFPLLLNLPSFATHYPGILSFHFTAFPAVVVYWFYCTVHELYRALRPLFNICLFNPRTILPGSIRFSHHLPGSHVWIPITVVALLFLIRYWDWGISITFAAVYLPFPPTGRCVLPFVVPDVHFSFYHMGSLDGGTLLPHHHP